MKSVAKPQSEAQPRPETRPESHPEPREPDRPATIADVARRAGVSPATVSRALSGQAVVKPETRARIEEAARALHYTPNLAARQLGSGRSLMIGLVLPDLTNPFFPLLAQGAADVARAHGYSLVLANSDGDAAVEASQTAALLQRRVDGLLLAPAHSSSPHAVDAPIPCVMIDQPAGDLPFDCVTVDNEAGIEAAVAHLAGLGREHIAYIGGPPEIPSAQARTAGFVRGMAAAGLPVRPEWQLIGDYRLNAGFQAMQALLAQPERPDAVVCANDLMAFGAIRAAQRAGLRVPEDIAVVGFDDIPYAELTEPALTTIAQSPYRVGAVGMERLLRRVSGKLTGPGETTVLPVRLVVRASCGAAKPANRTAGGHVEWL